MLRNQPTIRAIVVHHYYLLEQVFRGAVDDAAQGSLDDGQGLVQVDQHHPETRQVLWVDLFHAPVQAHKVKSLSSASVRCGDAVRSRLTGLAS